MKTHRNTFQHLFSFLLAVLLIFSSVSLGAASPNGDRAALVRIDLHSPGEAETLAALEIPIYARLVDADGKVSLVAFVNYLQLAASEGQRLSIRVLDDHPQAQDYFWVQLPTPQARGKLASMGTVLDYFENQALIAVNPGAAEILFQSGLNVKHLSLQPLPPVEAQAASQIPDTIVPDPQVQAMLNQVTTSLVSSYDAGLSGVNPVMIGGNSYTILTRHSSNTTASTMITQYAYEQFDDLGLSVAYHNYTHPFYGARRNVVAEQTGSSEPGRIFLITAHIDDMPSGSLAPGADDNASGSTGVLLAAEILSQYDFDCTLRYVLFTGEEQGLYGSYYYAQDAYNAGDNIEAVLNLDMIAYNSDSLPRLDLHTRYNNTGDLAIANLFDDVVAAYNLNLSPQIFQDSMGYSDHDSFWDYGFPAILAIEDDDDFTPYYHTTSDTLGTLNLAYFTDFIKAALGTMAHMGGLSASTGTVSGYVTEADGSTPIAGATVKASSSGKTGQLSTSSAITQLDGSYVLTLFEGSYDMETGYTGFITQTITNINVTVNQTTTVNFVLDAIPTEPVSGVDFNFQPDPVVMGEPVIFTGTVISGTPPIDFDWNFGDGSLGVGSIVTHTFPIGNAAQVYTVTLTASNPYGPAQVVEHPVMIRAEYSLFLPVVLNIIP